MMEFIFIGTNVAVEIYLKRHKRTEKEDSRLTKQKSRPKTDAETDFVTNTIQNC